MNDEVQRSLDLLDKVLSEFDDMDNANSATVGVVERSQSAPSTATWIDCKTPDHSEDDGYMSMNGRKAKMLANLKKQVDDEESNGTTPISRTVDYHFPNENQNGSTAATDRPDFPPPPEEAERIISNLLPRVSPYNSSKKKTAKSDREFLSSIALTIEENALDSIGQRRKSSTATQTTLPKTKHQRPFGWEKDNDHHRQDRNTSGKLTNGLSRFSSLPSDSAAINYDEYRQPSTGGTWSQWRSGQLPPRTLAASADRHREVRRSQQPAESSTEMVDEPQATTLNTVLEMTDDDLANFSDDSLEDVPPPPPPFPTTSSPNSINKRNSIAWEVPIDTDSEALLVPGSTKVVGRRRRKSADRSSTSSLSALHTLDDWPDPPANLEDSFTYFTSDTDAEGKDGSSYLYNELSKKAASSCSGTYVIRRGTKKTRKQLQSLVSNSSSSDHQPSRSQTPITPNGEIKRCSSTFDNIKLLLKEGLVEGLDDSPPDFLPPRPAATTKLIKVHSLPNLLGDGAAITVRADSAQSGRCYVNKERYCNTTEKEVTAEYRTAEQPHKQNDAEPEYAVIDGGKQSIAVQVSADFSTLNKQIAEQSASCQTDPDLNCCPHNKTVNGSVTILDAEQTDSDVPPDCPEKDYDVNGSLALTTPDSSIEDLLTYGSVPKCDKRCNGKNAKTDPKLDVAEEESLVDDNWVSVSEVATMPKVPLDRNCSSASCLTANGQNRNSRKDEKKHSSSSADFPVNVEILHHHEFGPLPPSPVEEELEEEYSDVVHTELGRSSVEAPTMPVSATSLSCRYFEKKKNEYSNSSWRGNKMSSADMFAAHREHSSSLKTRSVDAGYTRSHRNQFFGSRKEVPVERRTLPTDLPGTSHRRPYHKRSSHSPRDEHCTANSTGQISCSLPETPIFGRGCDVPRTPHRNNSEISSSLRGTPRLNGIQTTGGGGGGGGGGSYMRNLSLGHGTSLGEAMAGAELLRMTGPGRGWYPRHRQPRPASVEHLDRLGPQRLSPNTPITASWDTRESRKPLTLPPNLSPKFFQRSPREALRRVTSLLIRKGGNSSKDQKSKDVFASSVIGPHGDFGESSRQPKRGFFRSLWKRSSRQHYSFDQSPSPGSSQ